MGGPDHRKVLGAFCISKPLCDSAAKDMSLYAT